jgi:putative phosphoribosyl transferase
MTSSDDRAGSEAEIVIPPAGLEGILTLPARGSGIVVFAHGSGSSRLSPRNRLVAEGLHQAGLGTLLFDLLSPHEAADRAKVFDIGLLADRLAMAVDWLTVEPQTRDLPVGLFGASTGAAAALVAETRIVRPVGAIVSRGGRPDLAGEALPRVRAPTLLIVGGGDRGVIELNREAFDRLACEKDMVLVEGAGHLFEEPGTLETVVEIARGWLARRLGGIGTVQAPPPEARRSGA